MANATQDPSVFDHINIDAAMPALMDINAVPLSWQNTEEAIAEKRGARNEQAAQQQLIEAAPALAGTLKAGGGEALLETLQKLRGWVATRRTNYIRTFNNPAGEAVLKDLARFCRAHDTTFHPDARIDAALQGRREVWLRIQQHLNLPEHELWEMYQPRGKPVE